MGGRVCMVVQRIKNYYPDNQLRFMTAEKFRSLALEIPDALEGSHMDHADFRIGGKIFATLGYPDESFGMVKLSPELQKELIEQSPEAFVPCTGGWGQKGSTNVCLAQAKAGEVSAALKAASKFIAAKAK